jgi:hypothetical protein
MCLPMPPFCSRLIISIYILAQKVWSRSAVRRAISAQLPEDARWGRIREITILASADRRSRFTGTL